MCGSLRGLPFPILTTRCEVGGIGIVGMTIPIEKDPGTNPTSLRILDWGGLLLNVGIFSVIVALCRFVLLKVDSGSASHHCVGINQNNEDILHPSTKRNEVLDLIEEDYHEDQLQWTDEFTEKVNQANVDILSGKGRIRNPETSI